MLPTRVNIIIIIKPTLKPTTVSTDEVTITIHPEKRTPCSRLLRFITDTTLLAAALPKKPYTTTFSKSVMEKRGILVLNPRNWMNMRHTTANSTSGPSID